MRTERASAFERQFLAWMHIRLGVLPKPSAGIPGQWTLDYNSGPVTFTVRPAAIGATGNDWMLRIEEREPCTFIERVERHFQPGSSVRRRKPNGLIRVQFKSAALFQPFTDQTDQT